jgi:hypothetical protein
MEPRRRQQIALGALAIVLIGGLLYMYWPRTTTAARATSNVKGTTSRTRAEAPVTAPDVHLEVLNAPRPKPDDVNRNLFTFKPKPAPTPLPAAVPRAAMPPPPSAPVGPPPLPDIPLKFAMILTQGPEKVAVLLDPLGHQIYAKEGETIEGRYKVWRIGVESIDISYLDGRGRKTIRMSGS